MNFVVLLEFEGSHLFWASHFCCSADDVFRDNTGPSLQLGGEGPRGTATRLKTTLALDTTFLRKYRHQESSASCLIYF